MKLTQIAKGVVEAVLLTPHDKLVAEPAGLIEISHALGVLGDRHGGRHRIGGHDDALVELGYSKGTPTANVRQFSLVSREELNEIACVMGVPGGVMPPGLLAENLIFSGIPNLTDCLQAGMLLSFVRHPGELCPRALLAVWGPNQPCGYPQRNITSHFGGREEFKPKVSFRKAAQGRRGVVGFVYVPGTICPGDIVTVWQ